ncbi:tyrosine-type recombinase/integrase [Urechidicola vernalis]|uniref:Phage integrase SAM-like domain-containing protein n=1 Tax=Urechidicola vernalis TaxID=3075600 RepID=A0ABU2Y8P8_9FLAO|nr:phage integrase SAM-like domain-containing protein [Urechidicola sp. P050]MDT0554039.1 phage integrase SAM-like domain-containing protein [Urechidicola sp. P050]
MATANFLYRSTRVKAPLILRIRFNKNKKSCYLDCPIKEEVEREYWEKKHFSNSKDVLIKNKQIELSKELLKIEEFILDALKYEESIDAVTKPWLKAQMEYYYNPPERLNQDVSYWIQKIIDEAPFRDNAKGGIGLSKSRVNSYKILLLHFDNFQGGRKIIVEQMDKSLFENFKKYLLAEKNFAPTYALKKIADLKTVCKEARSNGVKASVELSDIKVKQVSPYDDDMDVIPLTLQDIEKIEKADLKRPALINARKWLILGVFTGQRGETLTKRIVEKNFYSYGNGLEIRVTQKKGNKPVRIPVLPRVKKIFEEGLPYSISTQKLRLHFKEIGKIAKIDEMVNGRITEAIEVKGTDKKIRRGIKKMREKYNYIGLHTLRRSFACIHEGKIPREVIMKVTGHKKIETYLQYVNQDRNEHLDVFMDYYNKEEKKSKGNSTLSVVSRKYGVS